ncbi:MAG: adenylosuccinate lyase [Bdellovibrionales bacterium]|nr:adenylosuccinate lyase [Bdellovibrionales bacterium]
MIARYSRPELLQIWSDESKFSIWLEVETLALEAMAKRGDVPQEAVDAVRAKGAFSVERVLEIENEVKHDVIAFLTNVAEHVGPLSRYVHRGMTSNDLLDTTFAVQLARSGKEILNVLDRVMAALRNQAERWKNTPTIGRSHGIHAEPTSFGLKFAGWYAELCRRKENLEHALAGVSVGKLSGAVGTYASLPPDVESYVMEHLGLTAEVVPTQVVARDRHAEFFTSLALLGSSLERFCVEIRHLQRTEVGEVSEPFGSNQKGSSAMPHKKNPILTENLTGLARLLRGYAQSAMENVALWHERDISHSSVERVIAPDACTLAHFMLYRFEGIVSALVVHEDRIQHNLEFTRGLIFSGTLLIALVDAGVTREDAYRLVQTHALAAWEGGEDFPTRVRADNELTSKISSEKLQEVFDVRRHLSYVDLIFERAMNE